jgi:HKD family nuclease
MIMILDPDTNTATTFSTAPYNSIDSYGLIAGPNGKIYLAPYGSTNFVSFSFLNNNNWNINVATNPMFNKN